MAYAIRQEKLDPSVALPRQGVWVIARWNGQLDETFARLIVKDLGGWGRQVWELAKGASPMTPPLYFYTLTEDLLDRELCFSDLDTLRPVGLQKTGVKNADGTRKVYNRKI